MSGVPLRYLVGLNRQTLPETTAADFAFHYVDISQVSADGNVLVPAEFTHFSEAPSRARRLAEPGDTIVSTIRTYLRAITQAPACVDPVVFSTGFAVLSPLSIEPRFLAYSCRAEPFVHEVVSRSTGVSYPAINPSELLNVKIPLPNTQEQRRVADFLDKQVTRIDRIVVARRAQIARLKKVREAYIQQLQDDLVRLYGESRLSHLIVGLEQGWSPQADSVPATSNEWGVMRAGCVNGGRFQSDDNKRLPEGLEVRGEYEIRAGDLLLSRASGSLDLIGSVAVVPASVRHRLLLCDKIYRISPAEGWGTDFLAHMLRTRKSREQIRLGVSGAEGMANNLPSGIVRNLCIPMVPARLQPSVVKTMEAYVDSERVAASGLSHSIDLLGEYKSSLITAAVTGKIDATTTRGGIPA